MQKAVIFHILFRPSVRKFMKSRTLQKAVPSAIVFFIVLIMQVVICRASPKGGTCNIVLITIDTLRADHLSCYGYERKTSPNIDSLAAQGIICRSVHATSSWTAPSMASLFTSVYPVHHGVNHGVGYQAGKTLNFQEVFSPDLVTLTEALTGQGYTTFGVASNLHLGDKFGFERGFDYFSCLPFLPADKVNESVYAWEDEIKNAEKFFLWIHYVDPHAPYFAQEPWIRKYAAEVGTLEMLDQQRHSLTEWTGQMQRLEENVDSLDHCQALYDSEINYVDAQLGRLMQRLNLGTNTLIIITSDHGEEFLEHGERGHGKNLYQETVRVPLVVKFPGHLKGTIPDLPMSLIDVMPTILDMLNITPPPGILGRSYWQEKNLLTWFKGKVIGSDREYYYSELETKCSLKAIFSPPWKYIYDFKNNTGQLYNIRTDSGEIFDRGSTETGVGNQLKDQLFRWVETARRWPTTKYGEELSKELKEKLKGLGYL